MYVSFHQFRKDQRVLRASFNWMIRKYPISYIQQACGGGYMCTPSYTVRRYLLSPIQSVYIGKVRVCLQVYGKKMMLMLLTFLHYNLKFLVQRVFQKCFYARFSVFCHLSLVNYANTGLLFLVIVLKTLQISNNNKPLSKTICS